ncbi:glycosyltransferase family 4 protein [Vibrio atypicus]|uniref:glycosyltransferase family 4 protein n=1 Tax=Vibrio atypicus TaxID=558271 RepID=UPI00135916E0|nr:glycosyltransferase family 4 protein [Vibrio atypicus]
MTDRTLIHINLASGFGGGEVQTLNLIEQLSGYHQLIVCKKGREFEQKARELGEAKTDIKVATFWSAFYCVLMKKNVVIHAHDGRGAHLARLLALFSGKKYLISRRVDKPLKGKLSEQTYRGAGALVAVSQKVAANLHELNNNISVIHDSYSHLPSSQSVDERLAELNDKFVVTQLGSLLDIKNVPFTIELAKQVEHSHPHVHFLIVGKGKEELSLKEQAKELSNVTFFGFTPYVASILERTQLLIMPSKSEGLGSAVLEAYQHNKPVMTSKSGGLPEIVQHGQTGYLVDIDNTEQAKAYLVDLVNDRALYERLQENIGQIKHQYSPQSMATNYIECYQKL